MKNRTSEKKSNLLIFEKSPYLLQHAYNPVRWHPWSQEAFEKAKDENKPVFLSIGYSTCHWCHVMEKESFADEEVAELLNRYFISIKVDREERPDIDQIYTTFAQMSTGQGGWPLNVFLTADQKPFYGGTYYPKNSRNGRMGLLDVLGGIASEWEEKRSELVSSAQRITRLLNDLEKSYKPGVIDDEILQEAYDQLKEKYDPVNGGFNGAPKFPAPHILFFLMRYYKVTKDAFAMEMVEKTLDQMYKGGIFDHIGYGFSRYSTDEKWLVPHFEKMLYDNALLVIAYTEAYQITKKASYKEVAQKIITYLIRDMKSYEGGFYSAEDADSEGIEGKFYTWSKQKVEKILDPEQAKLLFDYYPMEKFGSFQGQNIVNLLSTDLQQLEKDPVTRENLDAVLKVLFDHRKKRVHPHKDDKILTSWNALVIVALAKAGRVFGDETSIGHAKAAMRFIELQLTDDNGRLRVRYRKGESKYFGYLDDYAFMVWAYIDLYESTFETQYIEKAFVKMEKIINEFGDDEGHKGFYFYGKENERLISKPKEIFDGAMPSSNALVLFSLIKLGKIGNRKDYLKKAESMLTYFASKMNQVPIACPMMLVAKMMRDFGKEEVVLVGELNDPEIQEMIAEINHHFMPFAFVLLNKNDRDFININPILKNLQQLDDKATAYVCNWAGCKPPVDNVKGLRQLLKTDE